MPIRESEQQHQQQLTCFEVLVEDGIKLGKGLSVDAVGMHGLAVVLQRARVLLLM